MINLKYQRQELLKQIDSVISSLPKDIRDGCEFKKDRLNEFRNTETDKKFTFQIGKTTYTINNCYENLYRFRDKVEKQFPKQINDYKPYKFKPHKQVHKKNGKHIPSWVDLDTFHDYIKLTGLKEDYWMFYYSYGRTPKIVERSYNWHNSGHDFCSKIDGV